MEKRKNFTVSVYTENNVGLLHRISAIFLKRHINIESFTTSESEIKNVYRFIIVVKMTKSGIERVNNRKDLKPAVERMIKSKKPYVLEVCVEKEDNVFPMIPSGASVSDIRLD